MKGYLLDTDTWIEYFHNRHGVAEHIAALPVDQIFVSEISIAEMTYGAIHSKNVSRHLAEVDAIADTFPVLTISDVQLDNAEIRHHLFNQNRKNVGDFDILIGATAHHYGLTLVTDNLKDFELMPDLMIENWVER